MVDTAVVVFAHLVLSYRLVALSAFAHGVGTLGYPTNSIATATSSLLRHFKFKLLTIIKLTSRLRVTRKS